MAVDGRDSRSEVSVNMYSLADFVSGTARQDRGQGFFELESERLLEVNLDGMVWTKMGSIQGRRP